MKFVLDENIVLGEGIFTMIFHGTLSDVDGILGSRTIAAKRNVDSNLLRREAGFLNLCRHPNVIKFEGLAEFKTQSYLLMEFAPEGSLQNHLGLNKFSLSQKLSFIRQICLGLHHIHSRSILHGDLKPGHILLKNFQQVAITDFSSAQGPGGGAHPCIGLDIVPEAQYTLESDVYLLALVAYQILEDKKYVSRKTLGVEIKNKACRPRGLDRRIFEKRTWALMIVNTVLQTPENRPKVLEFHDAFKE